MGNKNKQSDEFPSLSRLELLILGMLAGASELYGLEMVEASGGKLRRGTIYVTLQRMQEKGYVDSRKESRTAPEIGIPRRLYSITGNLSPSRNFALIILVPSKKSHNTERAGG